MQSQRQSEVNNIVNALSIAGQISQFKPEVLDKINGDKAVEQVFNITGVSTDLLNSDEEVRAIREARAESQAQTDEMAAAQSLAQTYKDAAQGDKNARESQSEK